MQIQIRRKVSTLLSFLSTLYLTSITAFADNSVSEIEIQGRLFQIFSMLKTLANRGAALTIAISCIVLIVNNNENAAERARTAIKYALIAVAVFQLINAAYGFGKGLFLGAWDPYNPGV